MILSKDKHTQKYGVKGYIPKKNYTSMLHKPKSGLKPPNLKSLKDLNRNDALFYFWSSPVYTKAATLLAVAQAANLKIDTSKFN